MRVRVFAPAKINLTLHVGAPMRDGRHPVESVAVFANAGDWVWAEDDERPSLSVAGPFAPWLAGERDNLVVRAARLLAAEAGIARGVKLTLDKHLPVAAGIGGGSADAAATLRALDALWGLNLSMRDLMRLAAQIGADGPACVGSFPCYMTGAGETALALPDWPDLDAVLVNPGVAAPTGDVYRRFDVMGLGAALSGGGTPEISSATRALNYVLNGRNDLTAPAVAIAPAIQNVLDLLSSMSGVLLARLSGSGATCFALTAGVARGHEIAREIAEKQPSWWVRAVRLERTDVTAQRV